MQKDPAHVHLAGGVLAVVHVAVEMLRLKALVVLVIVGGGGAGPGGHQLRQPGVVVRRHAAVRVTVSSVTCIQQKETYPLLMSHDRIKYPF